MVVSETYVTIDVTFQVRPTNSVNNNTRWYPNPEEN